MVSETKLHDPKCRAALLQLAVPMVQIVLIGDHQQLPPTVISMDPESQRLLGTSLFQRIAAIKQAVTEDHQASGTGDSAL